MFLAAKSAFGSGSFGSIFATGKTIAFTIGLGFSTKRSFGSTTIKFATRDRKRHDFRIYIYYTTIFLASSIRYDTEKNKPLLF